MVVVEEVTGTLVAVEWVEIKVEVGAVVAVVVIVDEDIVDGGEVVEGVAVGTLWLVLLVVLRRQ